MLWIPSLNSRGFDNWLSQRWVWGRSIWRSLSKWLTLSHDFLHSLMLLVRLSILSSLLAAIEGNLTWTCFLSPITQHCLICLCGIQLSFNQCFTLQLFTYILPPQLCLGIFFILSKTYLCFSSFCILLRGWWDWDFLFLFFFFLRPIIPKVTEGFKHCLWSQCSPALQGIYKKYKNQTLVFKTDQLNIFFCGVAVGVRYLHGFAATDP